LPGLAENRLADTHTRPGLRVAFRKNLDAVADAYCKEFRQESVGIVTTMACARF
jgi:hypothetical protein